jgi:hypothetical protein
MHQAAQVDLPGRVDQIRAGRDDDRATRGRQRVDCRLDGGRIVVQTVAIGAVGLDVEDPQRRVSVLERRRAYDLVNADDAGERREVREREGIRLDALGSDGSAARSARPSAR